MYDAALETLKAGMPARLYVAERNGRISGGPVLASEGIAGKLRYLREREGMTQKQAAEAQNIVQSCIPRLEDFTETPGISLRVLVRHLKVLGYELDLTFRQVGTPDDDIEIPTTSTSTLAVGRVVAINTPAPLLIDEDE